MVDLDELDRLHAALKSGQIEAVIVGQAREVVTLLRAYPALAAEVRALRAVMASQAEMIESDVSAADQHGKGGQQAGVPHLVGANPHVRQYLRHIARDLRAALAKVPR